MEKQEKLQELYRIICSLENEEQCRQLFEDLCTQKELEKMAEEIIRTLPHSIDAEKAVLGAVILSKDAAELASEKLCPDAEHML